LSFVGELIIGGGGVQGVGGMGDEGRTCGPQNLTTRNTLHVPV